MPNNKVNWESLHRELMKQSDERHDMEVRLIGVFSEGLQNIQKDMKDERERCDTRFVKIEEDIVDLKISDKKWAGITGLAAAGMAALAGWFGQK